MADDIRRYSPPQTPITVTALEHEDGPTGAAPPPPKSVTTHSYPNAPLGEGEEAPEPEAPKAKAVKASDVEDKAVKAKRRA